MPKASGVSTALLDYFQERPGEVITIDKVVKAFPQWERRQLMSGIYNLSKSDAGKNIEPLQQGVWRLVTESRGKEHMQFEIVKTATTHMIGLDDEGNVYKITQLG